MTLPVSDRTLVRDAVLAAFKGQMGTDSLRLPEFDVSANYLTPEECKRFPTYCVIVTDETPSAFTLQSLDAEMNVTLVLYAKDDADVRALLDASIEDVYDTMLMVQQQLEGIAWKLALSSLTTDEGTTVAKPHAQAVQRWTCHHARKPKA